MTPDLLHRCREIWRRCRGEEGLIRTSDPHLGKVKLHRQRLGGGDDGGGHRDGHEGVRGKGRKSHRLPYDEGEGQIWSCGEWVTRRGPDDTREVYPQTELLAVDDPPVYDSTRLLWKPKVAVDVLMERIHMLGPVAGDHTTGASRGAVYGTESDDEAAVTRKMFPSSSFDRVVGRGDAAATADTVLGGIRWKKGYGERGSGGCPGTDSPVQMMSQFDQLEITGVLPLPRGVDAFERLNMIGAGTYGVVFRARDRETGEIVAMKKIDVDETGRLPAMALREIRIMASLRHCPCIVGIKEVVWQRDGVYIVMEYVERELKKVVDGMRRQFNEGEVKFLMLQLLRGVKCIHDRGVLHRDLKTSNLLLTRRGELKVCDFGLSRRCINSDVIRGVQEQHPYTDWVVTLWYRAPELLLNAGRYSAAIDMWSVGCIMAELLGKAPVFRGRNEVDQLHQIFSVCGIPDEKSWPGYTALCAQMNIAFPWRTHNRLRRMFPPTRLSEAGFSLLVGFLTYDPCKRVTVDQALAHSWFQE